MNTYHFQPTELLFVETMMEVMCCIFFHFSYYFRRKVIKIIGIPNIPDKILSFRGIFFPNLHLILFPVVIDIPHSFEKSKEIDNDTPFPGTRLHVFFMAANDSPSPITKANLYRREMTDQVRHDRIERKVAFD